MGKDFSSAVLGIGIRSAPAQPKLRHFAAPLLRHLSPASIGALWVWLGPAGVALQISRASIRAQLRSELMRRFCVGVECLVREHVVYVHRGEPEALPNEWVAQTIAPGESAHRTSEGCTIYRTFQHHPKKKSLFIAISSARGGGKCHFP